MGRTRKQGDTALGRRITGLMDEGKVSLSELSARSGISVSYLSRIVRGEVTNPTIDFAVRIAGGLHVPTSELLGERPVAGRRSGRRPPTRELPLLATNGFDFPPLAAAELAELLGDLKKLLDGPELTPRRRAEVLKLLRSFVTWLRFHYGEES